MCLWIAHLVQLGYRVGAVKHSHHRQAGCEEGKDTAQLRAHGAEWVEFWGADSDWSQMAALGNEVDLILVEGGSSSPFPKLEIVRQQPARLERERVLARIGEDLNYLDPVGWTNWLRGRGLGEPGS